MTWLLNLFAPLLLYLGVPLPQRRVINFLGSGVTVVDNPSKNETDVTVSGAPTSGAFGAQTLSLGTQTPPQYQAQAGTSITTTDASTLPIFTYAIPAGKFTAITLSVYAWIVTSSTAFLYSNVASAAVVRVGSGAIVTSPVNGISSPFANASPPAPFAAAGSPGGISFTTSSNSLILQAQGLAIGSVAAWAAGNFTKGTLVTKGGNLYGVISISGAGTSTTGPSGTGTTTDNAGGNQVVWDYIGPTSGGVPITWCACFVQEYTT